MDWEEMKWSKSLKIVQQGYIHNTTLEVLDHKVIREFRVVDLRIEIIVKELELIISRSKKTRMMKRVVNLILGKEKRINIKCNLSLMKN